MKTKYFFLAGLATMMFASCADDAFVGDNSPNAQDVADNGAIKFGFNLPNRTRAGEFVGATAAEKLGGMFVVEGTKGSEQTESPSTTVVFDNYLVGYTANTAGETKSNTHNWEYVGKQTGITSPLRMTQATWNSLHSESTHAKVQSIKYWDYTQTQYDFIAWSTGTCEAVPVPVSPAEPAANTIQVSRINTGNTLSTTGFTMRAASATDLLKCYYTDITTVTKASGNYGKPVTLTFKNMAAKVRVALYETVPGYSVKDVQFYTADAPDPANPNDLGTKPIAATLFTTGANVLPQSGIVTVLYPHIGTSSASDKAYNKASITVSPGTSTSSTQAFGALTNQYRDQVGNEPTGKYLGTSLPAATYAGAAADNYYTAVVPNNNGYPLTLRVNYTLVSTDGSAEEIHVYGAKAVVPATYTVWQPNYAYTYIFKISDNTNGWTDTDHTAQGLFPITFDAVVTSFVDANAEQTTVTTVATPSITTYQQGHDHANKDEYSKSQKAGKDQANAKKLYVQVVDNSGATPSLKNDLNVSKKSLLFSISRAASEAEVMDALQNRTNAYDAASPTGRNGITLTSNGNIVNTVESIVNGVDDQPITVTANTTAEIAIGNLTADTYYAYVYSTTVPTEDEKVYHIAAGVIDGTTAANYYEVKITNIAASPCAANATAEAGKVYFVKNTDATGGSVTYTFKQTKVGDDVEGFYEASIPESKGTLSYSASHFYFDVYNQNNGAYAVKVIKVVD